MERKTEKPIVRLAREIGAFLFFGSYLVFFWFILFFIGHCAHTQPNSMKVFMDCYENNQCEGAK